MEFIDANISLVLYEPYIEEFGKEQFHNGFVYGVYITIWLVMMILCMRHCRFFP